MKDETRHAPDWEILRVGISGDIVLPDSPDYEFARRPAIARFHDARPQAIVYPESDADVSEVISFVRESGLRLVARSGGHSFAGYSSTDGVVVDISHMNSVSVTNGEVEVGAGARLGDVYDALDGFMDGFGLTIPAGCGPDVGISGLALGGGLGILGRRHGLSVDHLLKANVVLADGHIVECDKSRNEDLFWALRGAGGGNFGVVTSLTFDTLPAPETTVFHLKWPLAHAVAVIGAWQSWSPDAPDELAASLLVTAPGDIQRPPEVHVFGAMIEADAEPLLEEFIGLVGVAPDSSSRRRASYRETKRYLTELGDEMAGGNDGGTEAHPYSKSEFFGGMLPSENIAALAEHFEEGRVAGQSRILDFTPWGGAYNRVRPDATAFVHRDERFLLKQTVEIPPNASPHERDAALGWLDRSWELVHPFGSGGVYQNFPDPDLEGWAHAYYGENLERLVGIKARYDPENFFVFPQSLPVSASGLPTT